MSHMTYQDNMEIISDEIMYKVLKAVEDYDYNKYTQEDIITAINNDYRTPEDFAALLSPVGSKFLEEIAVQAKKETRKNFGNAVSLFTPLYIANYCENHCVYCGFNCKNKIKRAQLSYAEIEKEMQAIKATGLEEVLILTGESHTISHVEYIGNACKIARKYFNVVGLEVYPMDTHQYKHLYDCGADFVTVFQETYDTNTYGLVHPKGRKSVFPYRFNAQERALMGGIRGVGFAPLIGLSDFRKDVFATGIHAWYLQRKYPHAEIAFSCPRLRPVAGQESIAKQEVSEAELLQVIMAYRLFMPFSNITISSRESVSFRDNVIKIAATKISAGVDVGIGGHDKEDDSKGDEQFEINDNRSVKEIYQMLEEQDMQPVMSNYIYL